MQKKSVNHQETSLLSQYREFFKPAFEGVFFADSNGNIIEANPYGCKMFGYRYEEICNLSIQTLISPENIHNDPIRIEILSEDQTIIKERKLRRKDGSLFDAEIHGRRLPNNIILGIIRDISKLKETQKQLHLAETRFRKFVEMANGIVFSIDQNQRITYVNPQIKSMLGYDVEETIGKYANRIYFFGGD